MPAAVSDLRLPCRHDGFAGSSARVLERPGEFGMSLVCELVLCRTSICIEDFMPAVGPLGAVLPAFIDLQRP